MYYQRMSDDPIIKGFREGKAEIIRRYAIYLMEHDWTCRR